MKINALSDLQFKQLASEQLNGAAPKPATDKSDEKIRKAAQQFEALFIAYLLKSMRKSIPESNLFGNGISGDMYRGMFDEKIAEAVSGKGGIGLADNIVEYLQKHIKPEISEDSGQNTDNKKQDNVASAQHKLRTQN
jgi:flagellar protein FlgJ